MKFNKALIAVSAAALSFGVVACDGPKENAMEDAGEQNAEAVDDAADAAVANGTMTEDQAKDAVNAAEDKADAMEEAGENADQADGTTTDPT